MTAPPRSGWWTPRRVAALVLLELLLCLGDMTLGPWGRLHWEELFNARGGVHFACGHVEAAGNLQYRTFCGGCTAEGLMSAPLFRAFGPTVLVWKLVPLTFHAVIVAAGAALVGLAAPTRRSAAGALFVALIVAAPGYYRDLALTGWGNHAESMAFPLLAALLLCAAAGRGGLARAPLMLVAGATAGLGLWYCHTSGHALPALLLLALLAGRALSPLFLCGLAGGLLPWWLYHRDRAPAADYSADWIGQLHLSPPGALLDWLFGDYLRAGLWLDAEYAVPRPIPDLYWLGLWGLGLLGMALTLRGLRSPAAEPPGPSRQSAAARLAALYTPLALLGLLGAYVTRYDLWSNLPDLYEDPSFNLRYRIPLFPILALGAALLLPRLGGGERALPERLRRGALAALAALICVGVGLRLSQWEGPRPALVDLRVFRHGGWADLTVPPGEPLQRMLRGQGRPVDVEAARRWISAHQDPLPDCRLSHVFELGRRIGIGLDGEVGQRLDAYVPPALALTDTPGAADQLALGISRALVLPDDKLRGDTVTRLDALSTQSPALAAAVGAAAGASVANAWPASEDPGRPDGSLDERLFLGVCVARGVAWVEGRTGVRSWRDVARPPKGPPDAEARAALAGACLGTAPERGAAYWAGVGKTWAIRVGCEAEEAALLDEETAAAPAATQAWAAACPAERH